MRAKEVFKANYWKCVLAALVFTLVAGGSSSAFRSNDYSSLDTSFYEMGYHAGAFCAGLTLGLGVVIVLLLFVINPLRIGIYKFFVKNLHEKAELKELGFAWKTDKFVNMSFTLLLMSIFETLWSLLLIVPGIIKHYEYKMIPYLLAENPDMDREEAFAISKKMMKGNKMDAFVLDLSYIGWDILSGLSFGLLGIFWVEPYKQQAYAALYDAIKMSQNVQPVEEARAEFAQSEYAQPESAPADAVSEEADYADAEYPSDNQ